MESQSDKTLQNLAFLSHLKDIIHQRKVLADQNTAETTSYTVSLFRKGMNKIAQKVGEEAVELIIEAKDDNRELFKNEAADLIYHLLVLLEAKSVDLTEVIEVLEARHRQ